ncbi:uncharacterized protein LOC116658000 [Camelus ferus]|uniref:Uncharacterized protein LOC116658000 n=3 Tax=Camelus TaxID=9836 RepID=A0A8B8RJH5_CAMFR|nr:uncharacterized protein LOC116658000 [Camelus ferus]XP_045371741.1 uncharacterized protein LOC105067992 [Camelus bactrianus]
MTRPWRTAASQLDHHRKVKKTSSRFPAKSTPSYIDFSCHPWIRVQEPHRETQCAIGAEEPKNRCIKKIRRPRLSRSRERPALARFKGCLLYLINTFKARLGPESLGVEGEAEAGRVEEALLTGSRCRCPEVTICPRLCDAGSAGGGRRLATPSLSSGHDPDARVGAAEAGLGPRCTSRVTGRLDPRSILAKASWGLLTTSPPPGPHASTREGSHRAPAPVRPGPGRPSLGLCPGPAAGPAVGSPPLCFRFFFLLAFRWIYFKSSEGEKNQP